MFIKKRNNRKALALESLLTSSYQGLLVIRRIEMGIVDTSPSVIYDAIITLDKADDSVISNIINKNSVTVWLNDNISLEYIFAKYDKGVYIY